MTREAEDRAAAYLARCVCGHNQRRHEVAGFDGACIAEGCNCKTYRPVDLPGSTPQRKPPAPTPVTIEQVLKVAERFGDRRARLVAERITALVEELRALLKADQAKARAEQALDTLAELPPVRRAVGDRCPPPGARRHPRPAASWGGVVTAWAKARAYLGFGPTRAELQRRAALDLRMIEDLSGEVAAAARQGRSRGRLDAADWLEGRAAAHDLDAQHHKTATDKVSWHQAVADALEECAKDLRDCAE